MSDHDLNRRSFLAAGGLALGRHVVSAQEPATAPSYAGQYPDMLLAYLAAKLNALSARWDREREGIRTAAALEERNRFVRAKFVEMLHGYPEKTPLHPVVVKAVQRDGYRVENVMFESRPNFFVTGNLYLPASGKGPFPAIISPCGHYPLARMQPDYQFVYLNLVKAGFVVLAYDPIGQGERRHYWKPETGETESSLGPVFEHSMPGQLLLLLGENLTAYMVWDGMRAIDYLLTRPEVDKDKIGCAGHSGGGTLTMFISALDERVRCAVVNEGGTSHRWPVSLEPGSANWAVGCRAEPVPIGSLRNRPMRPARRHRAAPPAGAYRGVHAPLQPRRQPHPGALPSVRRAGEVRHRRSYRPACLYDEASPGHHALVLPVVLRSARARGASPNSKRNPRETCIARPMAPSATRARGTRSSR